MKNEYYILDYKNTPAPVFDALEFYYALSKYPADQQGKALEVLVWLLNGMN